MCDLTRGGDAAGAAPVPKGLAFEVSDLAFVRHWADNHDFDVVVRLDHGAAVGEDYEEVIAFQTPTSPLYRLIMWRNKETVFIQPIVGKTKQYGSVVEALSSVLRRPRITLTDIKATTWPPAALPS